MHLIDGIRDQMTCIPTVHEVAAGLATEAFNAAEGEGRAFALVTAGPGMTNAVTALASAWLESRELLMLGGQVKTEDLNRGEIRQRGIQEVDGRDIAAPVSVASVRMETPMARHEVAALVEQGRTGRRGPVFLEICLDVTAAPVVRADLEARAAARAARGPGAERRRHRAGARIAGGRRAPAAAARRRPDAHHGARAAARAARRRDPVHDDVERDRPRRLRRAALPRPAEHVGPALGERHHAERRPARRARHAPGPAADRLQLAAVRPRSARSCRSTSTPPSWPRATRASTSRSRPTPTRCWPGSWTASRSSARTGWPSAATCARCCRSPRRATSTARATSTRSASRSRSPTWRPPTTSSSRARRAAPTRCRCSPGSRRPAR